MKRLLLLVGLLAACAPSEQLARTQVLIVVQSELEGSALSRIEASVQSEDGLRGVGQPLSFVVSSSAGTNRFTLPLSFGIAQPKSGADTFRIVVAGYAQSNDGVERKLVEQKANVTFVSRRTVRLVLILGAACVDVQCTDANEVCYPGSTGATAAGSCGPVIKGAVDLVDPGAELVGVDVSMHDAGLPGSDAALHADTGADGDADGAISEPSTPDARPSPPDDAQLADAGTAPDPCANNPCAPGGECVAAGEQLSCTCRAGFLGTKTQRCFQVESSISGSYANVCAIRADGSVVWWGNINDGMPTVIPKLQDVDMVASGSYHACARKRDDHSLVCWGSNGSGELGRDEGLASTSEPVQVRTVTSAKTVVAHDTHTCAIDATDHAYCWGKNDLGQLGDGTRVSQRYVPVAVKGVQSIAQLALGELFTCARLIEGTVSCWGDNQVGQLGNGTSSATPSLSPQVVPGLSEVTELAAGGSFICALRKGGEVLCWGRTTYGDGVMTVQDIDSTSPKVLPAPAGLRALTAGEQHLCARAADGSAICRGFGGWGQLGDGKSLNRVDSWVTVAGLGEFDQLLATGHTTCARLRNGGVSCWGYNSGGQLGDGTKQASEHPLMVNGL